MTTRTIPMLQLLLCTLLGCASCSAPADKAPAQAVITADNCDITINLADVEDLTVTPHLISQFYRYYNQHHYELTYLPDFSSENNEPDWDALSLYILLCFHEENQDSSASAWQLTETQFTETMRKHMEPVIYTDRSSLYLSYDNGLYTSANFDLLGSTFYRLKTLTRDEQQICTATFDTLFFDELERTSPETSPNTRAVIDYAIKELGYTTEELSLGPKFKHTIESIFLQEDYAEILALSGQVTVQFTLTGDAESPFYYVSCL